MQDLRGQLRTVRWPRGTENTIVLPPHPRCTLDENDIIATFHTHPNTGEDYLEEPSVTDIRAVRDDPDLKGQFYIGEFILTEKKTYLISPRGRVSEVTDTQSLIFEE